MRELVLNQFVYFGFLQSTFLLGVYALSSKWRKSINEYLIVLIIVLMIGLIGKVIYASGLFGNSYKLIALSEYATFLFGATVFLFTRSSLYETRFSRKDLLHYIPGFLYFIVINIYFVFAPNELIAERIKSGELFGAVILFMGLGLIFNMGYWIASYILFISFRKSLDNEVSFVIKTQFFHRFLLAIGVCLICWSTVYIIGAFGHSWLEREVRPFIWMCIAFIILFIAYYGLKNPELYKVASFLNSTKYAKSRLSNSDLDELKDRLDSLMLEKKPYQNRNLLKADLAEMLGVNKPEVARLLNERIGMNFFEYINFFRIKEFVELAKSDKAKSHTFFGLAQEAGFNSKSTFNNSFKKIMGTSPKEYFSHEDTR